MPNFQTKSFTPINYPLQCEHVNFEWIAKSDKENLIYTSNGEENFFIKEIYREKNILIKGDKLAKPSMVKTLQKSLQDYQKATKSQPTYSNISSSKNRREKHNNILKHIDFFAKNFKDFAKSFEKINIEVGFGSGRHLLFQANKNPKNLYIGIEIHKPSIEQVIKQCDLQNLKNIIIIDFDARVLMEFFSSNSIYKIFVHFPVPWDKKPHRRVISHEFLNEALRVLDTGCNLELRTDSQNYFEYSLEQMLKYKQADIRIQKNRDLDITSKYEARWKRMQKAIYEVHFSSMQVSDEKQTPDELGFDFEVMQNSFSKQTMLKDGYFVNFEKNYTINENDFLWKIALGDTANVEHCYIIVQDKKARYFPKKLYATKNNLLAHKLVMKRLKNVKSN